MIQCDTCPINADCNNCLELIEGGSLRRKLNPPTRVQLIDLKNNEEYSGLLCGISRVGLLVETSAPRREYSLEIGDVKVHVSPVYHKGFENLIAFDIIKVVREAESDNRLSKDEYEFLYMDKKDVINSLTEHLQDDIKEKLREDLHNELLKSELLDRLMVGSTFKYEKGRLKQMSGGPFTYLKEQEMISLMEKAIKANKPERELIIDADNEKYIDIHSIPLGFQTGGFLSFDVTEIVQREKQLLQKQWETYKEVIRSITKGKMILTNDQEINELLHNYRKKSVFELVELKQLQYMRQDIKRDLIEEGISEDRHLQITLAIQEAATNALKHAAKGTMETWCSDQHIIFLIDDRGSGIQLNDLPKATLIQGFSTTSTLGQGFHLMSRFSDRVYIKSDAKGTRIGLVFNKKE
ncbi:hypothetical protein BK139_06780 [Paenibacillus sp. FSL R5-0490]|uniref:ATP-binding protein n=1 Tax=Paenibacillus sp. FSL R5-0490 TaxID=1920424 RepID=UPI00096D57A0|nr:ATP-binding protein [Paenibacillus sp. FSL R5-0490]OMF61539.1 hypothetical protein BK139_06780 [Paenibacillus sp. FSL R5-0490]